MDRAAGVLGISAALGGAGVGLYVAREAGLPDAWALAGAMAALPLAFWEARRHAGDARMALAWGYLPGALLFLLPLMSLMPLPAHVAHMFNARTLTHVWVDRYVGALLMLGAVLLATFARAYAFPGEGGGRAWGGRCVLAWTLLSAAVFGLLACLACRGFHKYVDCAVMNEVVWNISRGKGPVTLLHETQPIPASRSFWSCHFIPLWALVAPLYRLWSSPCLLLLLQSLAISAAAVPIYAFLRPRLGPRQAFGLALAYLLYPATQHGILRELHSFWAGPFVVGLWWALGRRRWGYAMAFALLALACREEIALVLAGVGLAILFEPGRRIAGALVLAASLAWFVLLVDRLMPSLGQAAGYHNYKFASLGHTNAEIVQTLLTRPLYTASLFLSSDKLANAMVFLMPLAGLPLLGGRTSLAALPVFALLFLSDLTGTHSYLLYYPLAALPFLFLGAGEALLRLERWGGVRLRNAAWAAVMGGSLAATVLFGPSPLGRTFWQRDYQLGAFSEPYHHRATYAQTSHARLGRALLSRIPSDATVCAQAFFLPHLARVKRMKSLPYVQGADYVLLDQKHPNRYEFGRPGEYEAFVRSLRGNPSWRCLFEEDGYLLFGRRPAPPVPLRSP